MHKAAQSLQTVQDGIKHKVKSQRVPGRANA